MIELSPDEAIVLDLVDAAKSSLSAILESYGHPRSKTSALENALDVTSFALAQMAAILKPLKEKVQTFEDSYNRLSVCSSFANNSLSSSFAFIPDDVLADIMLHCMPDHGSSLDSHSPFPLDLAGVCKKWRWLAFSTPSLWSSLQIELPHNPNLIPDRDPSYIRLSRRLDFFHSRSMDFPLEVHISHWSSFLTEAARRLLCQMSAHSRRWWKVYLRLDDSVSVFNEFASKPLPMLQTLLISPLPDSAPSPISPRVLHLPALRHLTLDTSMSNHFEFPWRQLRSLKYLHCNGDVGEIVSKAHNLVQLELCSSHRDWQASQSSITLPRLRYLTIDRMRILDLLLTPSLQHLSVTVQIFGYDLVAYHGNILARFTSLVSLTLSARELTLQHLPAYLANPTFLPNLRSVRFNGKPTSCYRTLDVDWFVPALRDALKARNQTSLPPLSILFYDRERMQRTYYCYLVLT